MHFFQNSYIEKAKIKNLHSTICLNVFPSSGRVALPPAFAHNERRGVWAAPRDSQTSSSCLDFHWRVRCAKTFQRYERWLWCNRKCNVGEKKKMHFSSFSYFSLSASLQFLKLLVTNVTPSSKYATSCHCDFKQHRLCIVHSFISVLFVTICLYPRPCWNCSPWLTGSGGIVSLKFSKHLLKTDFARCLT